MFNIEKLVFSCLTATSAGGCGHFGQAGLFIQAKIEIFLKIKLNFLHFFPDIVSMIGSALSAKEMFSNDCFKMATGMSIHRQR